MADKIDQLKIGSTNYDIDLPPDATPSIASLTVGGSSVLTEGYLGFTASGKNYPVEKSSGSKLYVNIPWENTWPTNYLVSASKSDSTLTVTDNAGNSYSLTDNNTTYNFSGTTFYSGNQNNAEHNANNAVKNGNYYYSSNGPTTSLGASTAEGALYVQSYSDSWVGQIAQDYRNGRLFVRGKNNGTWQSWVRIANYSEIPTNTNQLTNGAGFITGISKSDVTNALGYTPPTQDTTYSAATQSVAGLMSAADKTKLDGVAEGANNYSHPAYNAVSAGLYKIGRDASGHVTFGDSFSIPTSLPANGGTAAALSTDAGTATNPVYFSDGVPKACTYSLNKTVPADAVFTDSHEPANFIKTAAIIGTDGTNGAKLTLTKQDGTTVTFTNTNTQNSNTWRPFWLNGVDQGDTTLSIVDNASDDGTGGYIPVYWGVNDYEARPGIIATAQVTDTAIIAALNYTPASSTHTHTQYASSTHTHSQYFNNTGGYDLYARIGDFDGTVTIGNGVNGWEFNPDGTMASNYMNIAGDVGIVFSQDVLISGNDSYAGSTTTSDLVVQNGNVYANYFYAGSDIRLKENISDTTLDSNKLLDSLHIVDFNYKDDQDKKLTVGLIAQELEAILPEKYHDSFIQIKHKDENNYLNINETKLVYVALLALKDQKKKIDDLELRIKALESK